VIPTSLPPIRHHITTASGLQPAACTLNPKPSAQTRSQIAACCLQEDTQIVASLRTQTGKRAAARTVWLQVC